MQETAKMTEEMGIKSWMKDSSSQKTDLNSVLRSSQADYRATCSNQFLRGMLIPSDRNWEEQKTQGVHGGKENNPERGRCKGEALFHLIGQKHSSIGPFVKNKGRLEMTKQVKKNNLD